VNKVQVETEKKLEKVRMYANGMNGANALHLFFILFWKQREKNKLKEGTKKDHRPKLSICKKNEQSKCSLSPQTVRSRPGARICQR
jgi:hypothetical protein